jgi:hypothetical protein
VEAHWKLKAGVAREIEEPDLTWSAAMHCSMARAAWLKQICAPQYTLFFFANSQHKASVERYTCTPQVRGSPGTFVHRRYQLITLVA